MQTFIYIIVPARPGFADSWTTEEDIIMSAHFSYLKDLLSDGRLILAGPCTDAAFGIAIFEAESLKDAEQIALNDPAIKGGVMTHELHEFRISLKAN